MSDQNKTNSKYNFLPDAPVLHTLESLDSASSFHRHATDEIDHLKSLNKIFSQSIAFVGDYSHRINAKFDFGYESLKNLDDYIKSAGEVVVTSAEIRENFTITIASIGAYVGSILYFTLQGNWHTAPSELYYFSALRFTTTEGIVFETNPFAQITKFIVDKNNEPDMSSYVQQITAFVQGKQSLKGVGNM